MPLMTQVRPLGDEIRGQIFVRLLGQLVRYELEANDAREALES